MRPRATTSPQILIADDHGAIREGLKFLFAHVRPEWTVCAEAANSDEAIRQALSAKPDVILLDISMPGAWGLQAVPKMRAAGIASAILVFTFYRCESLGANVRAAGAQGFVTKYDAFGDIIRAIDVLLAGGEFFGAAQRCASA